MIHWQPRRRDKYPLILRVLIVFGFSALCWIAAFEGVLWMMHGIERIHDRSETISE